MIWLDQIPQGTLLGGYYALIACGLSLMFGVMRIINLAYGDFAILGVFAVWLLAAQTGISPFLALAAIIPLMALLGWALQHWVFERSLRAGPLDAPVDLDTGDVLRFAGDVPHSYAAIGDEARAIILMAYPTAALTDGAIHGALQTQKRH